VALALVGFIGLCLLVGAADTAFVHNGGWAWFLSLKAPPGTPPNWLFSPVWTALHLAMGTAAWLVWRRVGAGAALRLWGWQIAANAFWTPAFFGLHQSALALGVNLVLLVLTALTARAFARLVPAAGWLMLPCLGWTAYAAYLTTGFWWLNGV
jgi:tryptophan-rich sensory protein